MQSEPPSHAFEALPLKRFAVLAGVSHVTLRKLCNAGIVPRLPDGTIPAADGRAALAAYRAATRARKAPAVSSPAFQRPPPPPPPSAAPSPTPTPAPTPTPTSSAPAPPRKSVRAQPVAPSPDPLLECGSIQTAISRQRFQLLKIEEEKKRLELDKLRGDSVPVDAMKAEVARVCSAVAACLHSIPARVSVLCEGRDAVAIEALLSDAINEALAAFRRVKVPSLDCKAVPEVPESPEAPGGTDDADDSGDSDV